MNLRLILAGPGLLVLTLLKMPNEPEFGQWSEEELLNELRYLLAEDFIKIVERDNEYYFVINDEVDEV